MTHPTLTPIRFENGLWEGHLTAEAEPRISVMYRDQVLEGHTLSQEKDGWILQISVPVETLSDGVHTILIQDDATGDKLGDFTIIAGQPAETELLAELSLLRAELDMLKRVVRRLHEADG